VRRSQVPVQLTRDHLLPDDVAYLVQAAKPDRTAITERTVGDVVPACHVFSGHSTTVSATTPEMSAVLVLAGVGAVAAFARRLLVGVRYPAPENEGTEDGG